MKWRLLFGLCLSCFVTIHAQVSSYVPRKDLVAWFPLNASISDSSGFSNQLTNYNGVKFVSDRNGKGSAACHFNGVSQDLKANHSGSLSVSADLTIAAWVLDSISTSPYQTIVAKRHSGYWNYSLSISHDTSLTKKGKNKIVTSRRNTGPQVDFKFSFDTVPIGKWVHLAVTVHSDTVRFYINGKESSCLVDTNVLYPKSFGRVFSIPAKDPLSILSVGSSNDGTEYFKGRIDEVGIWKRALSRCEIRALVISKSWIDAKVYHNNSVYRCGIDSFTLTALPAMKSYLWSNGVTKPKNTVKKSGKYRLTITDSFGCEFRDTISVLFSNPKLSIGADSVLLKNCKRDSLRVSVGNKWTSVLWSNTKKDSFVFLKSTGYYWVKVQDTNACYANDTFYFGNAGKVDLTLVSIDSVRCNGGNTGKIVSSISGGFSPYQLKWNDPLGQTTTIVSNLAAGSYRGIFKDRFGCADTLDALVKQPNILYATVAATDSVNCFGGTDGRAFVSATGGVAPYNYKWSTNPVQTAPIAKGLPAGNYFVWVQDNYGCSDSNSATVFEPDSITLKIIAPEYTMKGAVISLSSVETPTQPYQYKWGPSTTFTKQVNARVPHVTIPNSGNVILTIVNSKGCPLSDTAYINVVLPPKEFMPTGFTPNADNLNEGFGLPIIFETISLRVYTRWGGLIFSSSPQESRWDGRINGSLAPPDVYYYEFEAKLKGTDQIISYGGNVTLIR